MSNNNYQSHFLVRHLDSVGESYFQHFKHAMSFSLRLLYAGIVCMLHAIFPFLFEKTGSEMICKLYDCMVQHRNDLTPDCDKKRAAEQQAYLKNEAENNEVNA